MQADGYSLDDKRDKVEANDLPDIVKEWKTRTHVIPDSDRESRKKKHFFVPVNEIIDNNYDLSINRYKEIDYTPPKYDKPEVILGRIEKLEQSINDNLDILKKIKR
ncbi:MAG: hypothetical protein ACE5GV_04475 [Candidatus Scalindua sp.]